MVEKNKHKILIVEDDTALLNLYVKKFSVSGFEVFTAEDGGEALKMATECNPDVMLLDIMLPVMNGFEVLKNLKNKAETKEIPVVILSNYGEMPNITEGLMSGAIEYLIKVEHTPEEVLDVVKETISEKESLIGKAFKES